MTGVKLSIQQLSISRPCLVAITLFTFFFRSPHCRGEASNFSIWELPMFIVIGCLGGLIGAVFNAANEHLTIWRMKRINHSKLRRFIEVIVVSFGVSVISFLMPLIWGRCTDLPKDMQDWTNQEKNLVEALVPFRCEPGKEYNEVASLILTEPDVAIKQLFHFREAGGEDNSTFSSGALFLFFVPYIAMAAVVYGIAVPSGLFVPSLLSGAAFGRLCGHLLHKLDHTSGTFADSGTYALMGAAAVLGGMARMTISLTVILLEATGDMQYVLPLMLTLMSARFTGNVFNEGLYDIHIRLKNIPFLEPEVPPIAERNEIVAGQVMSTEVKCLRPVERAGVVYDLLRSCSHGTFPIVDTASGGTLYGTASRSMLCTLLQRRAFGSPDVLEDYDASENLGPRRLSPLVQWDTIERAYPRYPAIEYVDIRESDRNCWLDLRPYANTAPYTVNETASIQVRPNQVSVMSSVSFADSSILTLDCPSPLPNTQRTYRLFRTLGLRFLCVVNHNNQVVGIITRKDLLPDSLTNSLLRGRNAHVIDDANMFT
jgi:chloride channel 7